MDLKKHMIDTIKEWQIKLGYREENVRLYYPGESLLELLQVDEGALSKSLEEFCDEMEPVFGRIKISGNFRRYCLDIPAKGCAYVANRVREPEFLKKFLMIVIDANNTIQQIRDCFAEYAEKKGCSYREEVIAEAIEQHIHQEHSQSGYAFYFVGDIEEEYVYWVEENEFGLGYHRFTHREYMDLKENKTRFK